LDNVRNPLKLRQYRKKSHDKLLQKIEQVDVNHECENIKSVMLESTEETIETRGKHIRNERWDEECKAAISRKNNRRKRCLQKRTRANQEQYTQARKEANKICEEKKKQCLNNRIQQVEEAHKQNETRKFFKDIRTFQNDRSPPIFTCKDENDILKTDKQEVLNRRRQYFADMKIDKKIKNQVQEEHTPENEIEIEPPTYKEVSDIIKN
jgi:hypothetical protein